MNIILLREASATARPRTITLTQIWAGALVLFGALPLLLGAGLFWVSHVQGGHTFSGSPGAAGTEQAQARTLSLLSRTDLTRLAQTVGRLRAQASRLDALSSRLGAVAGIPVGILHFPKTQPNAALVMSHWTVGGLQELAGQLRAAFVRRELQLAILTSVLTAHSVTASTTPGGWPVRGGWISSPFGPRPDPFTGRPGFHPGVDIAAPIGTPVRAMAAGVVVFAGMDGGFGRMVKVFDGHSEVTLYGHLSARYVHVGEVVNKGQLLGRVGDTGYSTGPHLHFEVLLHGTPINPIGFLDLADRH